MAEGVAFLIALREIARFGEDVCHCPSIRKHRRNAEALLPLSVDFAPGEQPGGGAAEDRGALGVGEFSRALQRSIVEAS